MPGCCTYGPSLPTRLPVYLLVRYRLLNFSLLLPHVYCVVVGLIADFGLYVAVVDYVAVVVPDLIVVW